MRFGPELFHKRTSGGGKKIDEIRAVPSSKPYGNIVFSY